MPTTTQTLQKGRYSIEQELSTKGSSTHFQAYDTMGEKPVSIFEIVPRLPRVATVSQRESHEAAFGVRAKAVSALRQKALPSVHGFFTDAGRYYVVTECVSGMDLMSICRDSGKTFPTSQLADWADSLLDALNALHNSRPSIVYREVYPENVILGQDGTVTLSLSALFQNSEPNAELSGNVSTSSRSIAFSPLEQIWSGLDAASQKVITNHYDEASEKLLKQDLDARSDIYSLGSTLYFLATGRIPVDALERSIEIIDGNVDPLVSPNKLDPSIPPEISDVIMKAMEIRREYRFDSAAIMRQVLRTALIRARERDAEAPTAASKQQVTQAADLPVKNGQPNGRVADDVARRLLEAEEKRLEAERRAAEAEKKLREAEEAQARITESFNLAQLEDDVLGLMSSTTPHISGKPDSGAKPVTSATTVHPDDGVDISAIFDDATAKAAEEESVALAKADVAVPAKEEPRPVQEGSKPNESQFLAVEGTLGSPSAFQSDLPQPVTGTGGVAAKGSFLPGIPIIAGGGALVLVVAIGGWMLLGGNSVSDEATTIQAQPAVNQEKPAEPAVQNAYQPTQTSEQPVSGPLEAPPATGDQQLPTQPEKTAAKPKKATPARTPAPKKAVTVDDLINDN